MNNKILHLLARCLAKSSRAAKVYCIELHQFGIECVLTNNLTEAVPNTCAITIAPICRPRCRLLRTILRFVFDSRRKSQRPYLLGIPLPFTRESELVIMIAV
jgi:hypothetical protein